MYYFHLYGPFVLCSRPPAKPLCMSAVLRQRGPAWDRSASQGTPQGPELLSLHILCASLYSLFLFPQAESWMPPRCPLFCSGWAGCTELLVRNLPEKLICHLSWPLRRLLAPSDLWSIHMSYCITAFLVAKWSMSLTGNTGWVSNIVYLQKSFKDESTERVLVPQQLGKGDI